MSKETDMKKKGGLIASYFVGTYIPSCAWLLEFFLCCDLMEITPTLRPNLKTKTKN